MLRGSRLSLFLGATCLFAAPAAATEPPPVPAPVPSVVIVTESALPVPSASAARPPEPSPAPAPEIVKAPPVAAAVPAGPTEPVVATGTSAIPQVATDSAGARAHFEQALTHYREGDYRRAVAELEAARRQDPVSADLIYNVAVVYEKLGDYPHSLAAWRQLRDRESNPSERRLIEATIVRLEGAARHQPSAPVTVVRVPRDETPHHPAYLPLSVAALVSAGAALGLGVAAVATTGGESPGDTPLYLGLAAGGLAVTAGALGLAAWRFDVAAQRRPDSTAIRLGLSGAF